jgi:RNA polymerase sigma-54 factor
MLSLSQRQSLHQRLSPQQVQYLKMLQLPVIALEQRIKQELEINPLLEDAAEVETDQDFDQEFDQDAPSSSEEQGDDGSGSTETDGLGKSDQERHEDFAWEDYVSGDAEGYKAPSFTGPDTEEYDELPQRAEESLSEQLLAQLMLQLMSEDDLTLAEEIIGNIDDHGYLRRDLREIIDDLNKFLASTRRAAGDLHAADGSVDREKIHTDSQHQEQADAPRFSDDDTLGDHHTLSDNDAALWSSDTIGRSPAKEENVPERTAATLSLQEMSQLSIEELARLLEQGTSATVLPQSRNGNHEEQVASSNGSLHLEPPHEETFSLEEAKGILHRIQRLDPPGIGARDLQECLLIQLEVDTDPSAAHRLAYRLLQEAYTEFTMKHFEKICSRLDCTIDELKEAIEVIRSLNPKPGEGAVSIIEDNYLTPDFVIERDGEDFVIIPNDRNVPVLRINRAYQELIRKGGRKEVDRDTRKFIREKFEAAKWFIASIQQRRQTMMKVMRAIVDLQMDFFLHGPDQIRPMIYKDVAERIEMDISTICRVVNGKYTQTDYGTFELRYFFSEKLETTSGEEVSTKIVKSRIEELIAEEDKHHPLSDDAISKEMEKAGFYVARRTVAKYREQLNIPVARLRRAL